MIEDVIRKGRLLDMYGAMLTDKQRRCMEMYFNDDFSLAEIGEELHISRQGVYDMLRRASKSLEQYEERLHFVHRMDEARRQIGEAAAFLEKGSGQDIDAARAILEAMDL